MWNGAKMLLLLTSVAYIRSLAQPVTLFLFKVLACLITDGAGGAGTLTYLDLVAHVGTLTTKSSGTEVVRIVEDPVRMDITHSVKSYLF